MVLLLDNIYQIPKELHDFVVLKVTEKESQADFLEFECSAKPKNQLRHCKQRGRMKYRLKGNRLLQCHLVGDILPFIDSLDNLFFLYSIMADVGQGEVRDPMEFKVSLLLVKRMMAWINSFWCWCPPMMKMKEMMMPPQTVKWQWKLSVPPDPPASPHGSRRPRGTQDP